MRALLFLSGLLLAACGSLWAGTSSFSPVDSGAADAGAADAAALRELVDRRARAFCENLGDCCQKNSFGYDVNGCRARLAGEIDPTYDVETGATIDPARIDACVARAAEYAQACVATRAVRQAYLDTCARVVSGPKSAGEACQRNAECRQPSEGNGVAICQQPLVGGDRVCMIRLPAAEGAPCASAAPSYSDCSADEALFCSSATWTCQKKQPLGAPCLDKYGCLAGTYCLGSPASCAAQVGPGENCGGYQDGCKDGDTCDPATKLCVKRLSEGSACGKSSDCRSDNCQATCRVEGLVVTKATCSG